MTLPARSSAPASGTAPGSARAARAPAGRPAAANASAENGPNAGANGTSDWTPPICAGLASFTGHLPIGVLGSAARVLVGGAWRCGLAGLGRRWLRRLRRGVGFVVRDGCIVGHRYRDRRHRLRRRATGTASRPVGDGRRLQPGRSALTVRGHRRRACAGSARERQQVERRPRATMARASTERDAEDHASSDRHAVACRRLRPLRTGDQAEQPPKPTTAIAIAIASSHHVACQLSRLTVLVEAAAGSRATTGATCRCQ